MENTEVKSVATEVYQILGEPAFVINGVPDVSVSESGVTEFDLSQEICGLGEWLEGREVRKLFDDDNYYSGTVISYDKETKWYKVEYEDGDSEELEWDELEPDLVPLDIALPLKSLALKITKKSKNKKPEAGAGRQSRKRKYLKHQV